jgi:aryl-alcohol dehydrogenase-like predicted oxidoreductase
VESAAWTAKTAAAVATMKYRNLGRSGLKVSSVSLGSWLTLGNVVDDSGSRRIVHAAFERGVNLFDTADVYAMGEGEKALGRAIAELPRHRLVLASKCFFPMSDDPNDRGLSRKHIHESIDATLQRLGTDYVDLYQCHRFDPETPVLETARAMDDLIRRGKVLYWGTSAWPAERIAEVSELCRREHLHAPISNQPLYNLFDRDIEAAVLSTSERCGLGQIVYSPLAQGVLTGKYTPGSTAAAGTRGADPESQRFIGRYLTEGRLQQASGLRELAERNGVAAAVLALAFCLRDARVSSVIVGARDEQQLETNLQAAHYHLSSSLIEELQDLFPA